MKQQLKKWIAAVALTILVTSIYAQNNSPVNIPWVSDKGYWTLESNIHTPLNHIIRFYTPEHVLVYTENLNGIKLDISKRRVKMKLKKALETTLLSWAQNKKQDANKNFVATLLK